MKIVFSIIVPIYKTEQYLSKCVASLIKQTYRNIEIILVEDGSPDNCPKLCDELAKQDSRITVIHKENGGLSDARNAGIEVATGDYILFVDSDDYIDVETCEMLLAYANKNVDIIANSGIAEGNIPFHLIQQGTAPDTIVSGYNYLKNGVMYGNVPMAAWLYVYRKEFLIKEKLRFEAGRLHEDEEFTPRAILKSHKIVNTGKSFYHYIIRENSITTQGDKRKNAQDLYKTCIELEKLYSNISDRDFKHALLNSLTEKYLNMFQTGKLQRYGKKYLHKDFVWKNAYHLRTRIKAFLYVVSPNLYWEVNNKTKNRGC